MSIDIWTTSVVAAFGLAVGSFLNVCIYRVPRRESIVTPPSHCPQCGASVRWYHNVPVLGYLALRGRCRDCGEPISIVYPLVEAGVALLFVLHFRHVGWQPLLISRLAFSSAMVALFVIDLQHQLLPNRITVPGVAVGLGLSTVMQPGWVSALIGAAAGGGILLAIAEAYERVRGEEGLGGGDVKMLAMIGAFLGWQLMLVTLMLASVLGSVVGVGLIATGRGGMKYKLPFGTFLAVGALTASVVGQPLLSWYLSFY